MTRNKDAMWGDDEEALQAAYDTFYDTNILPQAAGTNQAGFHNPRADDYESEKGLWGRLEKEVLEYAVDENLDKCCVINGPIFSDMDPTFGTDVHVPLRFFKIVAYISRDTNKLAAVGFVIPQQSFLKKRPGYNGLEADYYSDIHPLYQFTIEEIGKLTNLDFGILARRDVDVFKSKYGKGTQKPIRSKRELYFGDFNEY